MNLRNQLPFRPYPENLFDKDGGLTQEALNYIENWSYVYQDDKIYFGEYMAKPETLGSLIDYIKTIWCYDDAIVYDGKLLELSTFGWSGNEEIIPYLKKTELWTFKFRASQIGGHYFFNICDDEFTYEVRKVEKKW